MNSTSSQHVVRRSAGAIIGFIGFMLSPLSWWNDLLVNVPLALAMAWAVSWFNREIFEASFILAYWLTNVLGLVLMQVGGEAMLRAKPKPYTGLSLLRDAIMALLYTALIVLLVKWRVLAPLPDYFSSRK